MTTNKMINELLEDMELNWSDDQVLDFALAAFRDKLEESGDTNVQALHSEMKRER